MEPQQQQLFLRNILCRLIQGCKTPTQLKQIHTHIITTPKISKSDRFFLISRLLFFSAITIPASRSLGLTYAAHIFHHIKNPTFNLYNIMIRAYASNISEPPNSCRALLVFKQMIWSGIAPDCLTFPFLLKECSRRIDVLAGRGVHGQVVKFGVYDDVFVNNSMITFYSQCGLVESARKLFDEMLDKDVVSWNSMITGYLRSGDLDEALCLFRRMDKRRSIFTWNSLISGFVQGGRAKEALEFFHEMQCFGDDFKAVRPDKITVASVIAACTHLGSIHHGKWVHDYLRRSGLECDVVIGTALVDMYGKCGCLEKSFEVFREMPKKDTLAWTAMISVFAIHGCGKEAFDIFEEMEAEGMKPNHVTFVGLLSACAHAGLVEKGRWCFNVMRPVYSVEPHIHHYACMVDVLGRAGLFEEAEELIRSMPMKPDVFVWGALLGGCQMHGNVQIGERVANHLINLEPVNHAFYVNLIDIYAKAGRFDGVKRIRALMKERGIRKEVTGCSMIDVDGVVHEFSVKGCSDVAMEELVRVLTALNKEMKVVPIIDFLIDPILKFYCDEITMELQLSVR